MNLRDRFGAHAGAAIGEQGQRTGHDVLLVDGVGNQLLGELSGLAVGDHPTNNVAAENIQYDVQGKAGPLGRGAKESRAFKISSSRAG